MKEIEIKDLCKYINPMNMEEEPAIIVASDGNKTNGMTIGWAGFGVLWRKRMATIYIHKNRYSKHIFDRARYFSICFMKDENRKQLGYFGSVSGRDEDKMRNCGMETAVDLAPYFTNSRVTVICKVMGISDFDIGSVDDTVIDWYKKDGVHTQYYGEIMKVLVED